MTPGLRVGLAALAALAAGAAGIVVGVGGSGPGGGGSSVVAEPDPVHEVAPAPVRSDAPPDPVGTQPVWDPRRVDDLPLIDDPLPDRIEPPRSATPLAGSPVPAALLGVARGDTLFLLSTGSEWRSLSAPRSAPTAISDLGTGLVVQHDDVIEVWHLPTGRRTDVPYPAGLRRWDYLRTVWLDESTLLIDDHAGGWRVDVATGHAVRVPYPTRYLWSTDRDGTVLEAAGFDGAASLTDWATGAARHVAAAVRLSRFVVGGSTVAGTTYGSGPYAVVLADRAGLEPRAVLPVRDVEGDYSNWAMRPVAVRDDGTVLVWVAIPGPRHRDGWRLVTWDPESGVLAVASASDAGPTMPLRFAKGLLAATNS